MKRLPALYSILVLIGPLLVIAVLMAGPFGCGGGGGGGPTPVPTMGSLEIGLVDSPANAFQAIALNIVSVRLNPSTDANIPDSDPNWQTVTAPPGAGPGEVSVNLLDLQNNAMVFNIGQIPAQTYNQIEVVIDSSLPGIVIPSCTSGANEGCITANASFAGTTNLRFNAAPTHGFNVAATGLSVLVIDINPGTIVSPSAPGGNYTLNPTITAVSPANLLATVSGTVSGLTATSSDTINAELTGTNSVVASASIPQAGNYTLQLPANGSPVGTTYDLFVSGGTTFAVKSGVTLMRGGGATTVNFSVSSPGAGTVSGAVIDGRTGGALTGATVNLLLQESPADDCTTSLTGCVVVNTTTSDSIGNYAFATVPAPPATLSYFVQASMTGTQTVTQKLTFSSPSTCVGSPNPSNCSFRLPNVLLSGNVTVDPPPGPGSNIVVTVLAEQTGTGNLVGLTQVTVPAGGSAPFAMEVPPVPPNFDLIASAQDAYLGVGTEFSGHSLGVLSNVNPSTPPPGGITLTVACLGHGTISGLANLTPPNAGTHVRLFQDGVQLMDSTVGSTTGVAGAAPPFSTQYSFCAPPNTYTIQRFEQAAPTASPAAAGPTQVVIVPTPAPVATSSPCPLCENSGKACPGNCRATGASPL